MTALQSIERQVLSGLLPVHKLEAKVSSSDAVAIRRRWLAHKLGGVEHLPPHRLSFSSESSATTVEADTTAFYDSVKGRCCENVIGYIPLPVGIAGPLKIDGKEVLIPMATAEGALIASTSRGCKAISQSGGAKTAITNPRGMTRAPLVECRDATQASKLCEWVRSTKAFESLKTDFEKGSKHTKLISVVPFMSGRNVFLRFTANTGDAMGMNCIGKACEKALFGALKSKWGEDVKVLAVSGNMCTDKKPGAINPILGRGIGVCAEAVITEDILKDTLGGVTAKEIAKLNRMKSWLGSSMAAAGPGGLNAHAANTVAAVFLATGQDAAQVVSSSSCVTSMEVEDDEQDEKKRNGLRVSCTMPCLEVGTIGGGTELGAQKACLSLMGIEGSSEAKNRPSGTHPETLARIICATVMASELSLMSALCKGQLVSSHLKLNRKPSSL